MSAATLDEYTSVKPQPANSNQTHGNDTVHAERARILETVARKAQEKTLTLQETTDLYARFNQTYESTYRQKNLPQEDESWALKLLEECAQESDTENTLQTRVNGEPLTKRPIKLVKPPQTATSSHLKQKTKPSSQSEPNLTLNQALFAEDLISDTMNGEEDDKPKLKLREAFIYDQFRFSEDEPDYSARARANRTFWIILGVCGALTCAALVSISQLI